MSDNIPKILRQFVRLNLANYAFYQVKLQAEHIHQSGFVEGDPLLTPHMAGLVVTYAKNFTESEGIGPLPQKFAEFPKGILQHTHALLMESRHALYAHRDFTAAKSFTYDEKYPSEPYEMSVTFSKKDGMTCYPMVPELNKDILPHVIGLCGFQNTRIVEEVTKLMPILTAGKKYQEGVRYVVGKNFP